MTNYRFYLLNRHNHITTAQVAECDGADDIRRTALALLEEHQAAAAVEVWERDQVVFRAQRVTEALPARRDTE